jgi:hypothetical protein
MARRLDGGDHQQQHWRDYDPIALAVLFLCIGMVALAIGVP